MGSFLKGLKTIILLCIITILFASCEDDVIIAPKGQTQLGSYGKMSFPDSTSTREVVNSSNPEIF